MQCSKCGSTTLIRNGIVHARQRYRCKTYNYNFTLEHTSTAFSASIKQQALQLYLEGNEFRAIGRLLKVSHVSVYQWIWQMGEQATALQSHQRIDVVEIDELHTYIRHKKLLLGVDRYRHQFIDFVLGSRGYNTAKRLWQNLQTKTIR